MSDAPAAAPPSLAGADWLTDARLQAVLSALTAEGGEARVAGGAVRNALMGRPVADVDVATTEPPDRVVQLAEAAGLKAIPTGIEHGTVTVVAGDGEPRPFEVTTLRLDVETFGRHARVAFTAEWREDARRRDLTVNALYCDADGTVFDPLGAYEDIVVRRIRFVGHAAERIEEDYLRILRFFRFHAEYSERALDEEGLEACSKLRSGLSELSGERIWQELAKLLIAPHAVAVVEVMARMGILAEILPRPHCVDRFAALAAIEEARGLVPAPVVRLAALALAGPETAGHLRERLRLSNQESRRLEELAVLAPQMTSALEDDARKARLYRHGPDAFRAAVRIAWAEASASPDDAGWRELLAFSERWQPPAFPLRGRDLRALGLPQGPAIGEILSWIEERWIASGFSMSEAELRAELEARAAKALERRPRRKS